MFNRHQVLSREPLQSGGKFISPPIPTEKANSIKGWIHADEEGKLAIFQSYDRQGEYRKIYDVPVNKGQLTTFNIPTYSRYALLVFAQGLVGSTELEIIISLSEMGGEIEGTRNVATNETETI